MADSMASLTPSESVVVHFIVQHANDVLFLSAAEIAARLRVGAATVIRATQALGYAGLPELKRDLRATGATASGVPLEVAVDLPDPVSDAATNLARTVTYQAALIGRMGQSIDPIEFGRAVEYVAGADRIASLGFGMYPDHAAYFVRLLRRLGRNALEIVGRGDLMTADLLELRAGDVLVVLAYGRISKELAVVLEILRERDVPGVIIGDVLTTALRGPTVAVLTAERGTNHPFETAVVPFALLETLAFAVIGHDMDRFRASMDREQDIRVRLARSRSERSS